VYLQRVGRRRRWHSNECVIYSKEAACTQRQKQQPGHSSTSAVSSELKDCIEEPPRFNAM